MNHFSQEFQQTLWWTPQPALMEPNQSPLNSQFHRRPTTPFYNFNLNHHQEDEHHHHLSDDPQLQVPPTNKETMFEKPLTPSDVGKLNRLVIPKQHAERYFPLGGGNNNGGDPGEKGLLLNFEDEDGKCWRFRYSYWNSSQSYVLTKGWSRFVKDKRLDAGDVVLFERSRLDFDRLFIGWRRRNNNNGDGGGTAASQPAASSNNNGNGVGGGWTRMFYSAPSYPSHPSNGPSPLPPPVCSMPYPQPQQLPPSSAPGSCLHAATGRSQTTASGGSSKTLRLFGVNLECYQPEDESEPSTPDGSTISSQGAQAQYHHYTTTSQTHHMDMDYSGDVTQLQQMGRSSYHQS